MFPSVRSFFRLPMKSRAVGSVCTTGLYLLLLGGRCAEAASITSPSVPPIVLSGQDFRYQITADNNPTSFTASGLPPAIQLDSALGVISGRCPTSGVFQVAVTAQGATSTASGIIFININPLPIMSPSSFASQLLGDPFFYQITANNNP